MGKLLVVVGVVIAAIGLLMVAGVPFGRLPGDISYRRGNFSFYFPLGTSILISIILTLLFSLFRR
ncbi:MAG: DUF2905 domain-containing protein [Acidobacteria bacterium]|nr:MAG: DUF2905 domain-containing protein [Acidobacteriota bacterium]